MWIITKGTGALAKAKGDASKPNGRDLSNATGTMVVNAKGRVKG